MAEQLAVRFAYPFPMIRLAATVGVICISFSAILVRAADVSPSTAAVFRAVYAIPVLFAIWLFVRSRDHRTARTRLVAFAAGLFLALDLTVWHHSIGYIGAGLATVLANVQVVFVGIAGWVIWREKPARSVVWVAPLMAVGLVLVSGLGRADAYGSNPVLGVVLGATTGITYAGFLVVFRMATRREHAPAVGSLLDATIGLVCGAIVLGELFGSIAFRPTWPSAGWLIVLAVVSQSVGWLLIATALPRVPAIETSVLLLIQPIAAMLWGRLFFDETVSWIQGVGVALVIIGVVIVSTPIGRLRAMKAA
jgi:drug/metabolite transporter (DMT)-like permease